jgi:hypothetical protein
LNSVVICPDKLSNYPQNTLVKLQHNDSLAINLYSRGCFHSERSKLVITKENDKFIARLYEALWNYSGEKDKMVVNYKGWSLLKATTMTNQNLQDFIRFENELNYANDDGCTTTDRYEVKSKYLNISKSDGSCSWNGFFYLRKSLFGDNE